MAGSLHVRGRHSASAKSEAEGDVKLGARTIVSKMQQRRIFHSRLIRRIILQWALELVSPKFVRIPWSDVVYS